MQQQQLHFNSNCTTTDHRSETTATFLQPATAQQEFMSVQQPQLSLRLYFHLT
jgi:hypothetical protein